MEKLLKIGFGTYTGIVGLLIPIALLLKASSFNRDYYPTSFILFVALLVVIFVSAFSFQTISFSKSALKKLIQLLSFSSILTGTILQVIGSFSLFKEDITSAADIIVAGLYILLILLGIISLFAVSKASKS